MRDDEENILHGMHEMVKIEAQDTDEICMVPKNLNRVNMNTILKLTLIVAISDPVVIHLQNHDTTFINFKVHN